MELLHCSFLWVCMGMLAASSLALITNGIYVWLVDGSNWIYLKLSLIAFSAGLIPGVIFLGSEQNWWRIDNEKLDSFSLIWVIITTITCFTVYSQYK